MRRRRKRKRDKEIKEESHEKKDKKKKKMDTENLDASDNELDDDIFVDMRILLKDIR